MTIEILKKKEMKKITLLFFIMLLPVFADAQTTNVVIGKIWYAIRHTTRHTIATVIASQDENEKYAGHIFIPASIEYDGTTYPVIAIDAKAFYDCTDLISVTVEGNSISIWDSAFADCPNLTSVVIPDSILKLEQFAFCNCPKLSYITPPRYLKEVGYASFAYCHSLKSFPLPASLESIDPYAFTDCENLDSPINIPEGIKVVYEHTFDGCKRIPSITIPCSVTRIQYSAFAECLSLKDIYCHATTVPNTDSDAFYAWEETYLPQVTLHVPAVSIADYEATLPWNHLGTIVPLETQNEYRPFVEDGKVWKVGAENSGNPVQWVEYYYFDGDTIVDGKTCKQMMCQRYVNQDFAESYFVSQDHSLSYVGAWYEEGKKVYQYDTTSKLFKLMYDFSAEASDTLQINGDSYVIGPRQTGEMKGFKGVYRDVRMCKEGGRTVRSTPWLEGVGGIYGMTTNVIDGELAAPAWFLMSCTVGDEVIYLNEDYEDGASPEAARKRFDFTHTVKTKPKAPRRAMLGDGCWSAGDLARRGRTAALWRIQRAAAWHPSRPA